MRSHYWIVLAIVTTSLVLGYSVFSRSELPDLWQKQLRAEALRERVFVLYKEISDLSEEIKLLAGDSPGSLAFLEQIAREELGMIAKDEVLITIGKHRAQKGRTYSHEKNIHP